jgi:hypothetical protein
MTATRVPVDLVPSTASGKSRPSRDRSQSSGRADTRSAAQRARISSATPVIHVHDGILSSVRFRRRSGAGQGGVVGFVVASPSGCGRAGVTASGSRLGRSPTAQRPEGLDGGAGRRTLWGDRRRRGSAPFGLGVLGSSALISAGCPRRGAGRVAAAVHPFAAGVGRHDGVRCAGVGGVNQERRPRHGWGS